MNVSRAWTSPGCYSEKVSILDQLNDAQRAVAETTSGPLAVIAGPGTGKTKTLTARIAYLLQSGVARPDQLLAVTFTNKAAHEMRDRVQSLVKNRELPRIVTFHAFCLAVLEDAGKKVGEFVTDAERQSIIRELPKPDTLKDYGVRELGLLLSRFKNATDTSEFDPGVERLARRYDEALQHYGLGDFDNVLTETYALLTQNGDFRNTLQSRYTHLLVDEFQDTNELQYELMRLFTGTDAIMVIGDPLQSIYSFRGASGSIFNRFKKDFPSAKTITLSVNYRSHQKIVSLARATFPKELQLTAHSSEQGSVQIIKTLNEHSEADFVVETIQARFGGTDFLGAHNNDDGSAHYFRDFAVLYRTHRAARTLQRKFTQSGIPYQIAGEESAYAQPLLKIIIVLLGFLVREDAPTERELRTLTALKLPAEKITVIVERCKTKLEDMRPSAVIDLLIAECKLSDLAEKQADILRQFMNALVRFKQISLENAVSCLQQLQQNDCYDPLADAVTLMSIHAAKGLEFEHVFLCAAEEGILPHGRKNTDVEEERRLFYVAATRAKERLDITYAIQRGREPAVPSRFLLLDGFTHQEDTNLAGQEKRRRAWRQKSAQTTLFTL